MFTDNKCVYSTTVTYVVTKEIEISDKTQNKGYYNIPIHLRSCRSVTIDRTYATF